MILRLVVKDAYPQRLTERLKRSATATDIEKTSTPSIVM